MADFLDEKLREIQARLDELRPLVDEFHKLEAAEQALAGVSSAPKPSPGPPSRRPSGRPKGSSSSSSSDNGGRGRPKGSGQRAQQALELVRAKPGITIPEMAESMGIKQNYLYRVVPDLEKEGHVVKSGRGWHVRDQNSNTEPDLDEA